MKITARSNVGLVRLSNEDTFLIEKKDDANFIAFIADGMGGHLGGSFASNQTCEIIKEEYQKLDVSSLKSVGVWLFETIQKANLEIYKESLENNNLKGMGTTLSGILVIDNEVYYAHVGDSRIYVYNDFDLEQITTDHTYVNTLLLNGIINYKQALKHPKRHVLTNAIGIKKEASVDISPIKIKKNDKILICSDGLHNLLDGKKLHKDLLEKETIEQKADNLIDKALKLGGSDNITLILIDFEF